MHDELDPPLTKLLKLCLGYNMPANRLREILIDKGYSEKMVTGLTLRYMEMKEERVSNKPKPKWIKS